jgi:hypothetical protein
MRSYMNFAVVALAASVVSPTLSTPIQYRYGNLLVEFEGRGFLITGLPILDSTHAVDVFHARTTDENFPGSGSPPHDQKPSGSAPPLLPIVHVFVPRPGRNHRRPSHNLPTTRRHRHVSTSAQGPAPAPAPKGSDSGSDPDPGSDSGPGSDSDPGSDSTVRPPTPPTPKPGAHKPILTPTTTSGPSDRVDK